MPSPSPLTNALILDAGHNIKDPGAIAENGTQTITEATLTRNLRDSIAAYIKTTLGYKHIYVDNDADNLSATIKWASALAKPNDWLLSIHFNAGNALATGTEVLIAANAEPNVMTFASKISALVADTLHIKNRGVKTESQSAHKRLGILHTTPQALLLEVCFMSNPKDFALYTKYKDALVIAISQLLMLTVNQIAIK